MLPLSNHTTINHSRLDSPPDCDRHQLFRSFPELPVNEIGGKTPHKCELFRLPWPDLDGTRPKSHKRLLHQLLRGDHSDAALGKLCPHVGFHTGWHEFDDLDAAFLQLKSQGLRVRVNCRLGCAVDRRSGGSGTKASAEETLITVPLFAVRMSTNAEVVVMTPPRLMFTSAINPARSVAG